MDLKDLYREVILDHNKSPRLFGRLDPADSAADGHNPLCGDRLHVSVRLDGDPRPPEPWESGFKDTVIAYPGEVTRIRARFDTPGQFVWHCHIVEHEDNEMMRPYRIGPVQAGQPE